MAYDEVLADQIRTALADTPGLTEKKMFGGIGWMVGGHMAAGAHSDGRLMIRCAKADFESLTSEPGASPMMRGGKPLSGWVLVDAEVLDHGDAFARWIERGRAYAQSMPPKP